MKNKRDTKSNKKKLKLKYNTNKFYSNPSQWITNTIEKVFDKKLYKKLVDSLNQTDDGVPSKIILDKFSVRNKISEQLLHNIIKYRGLIRRLLNYLMRHDQDNYFFVLKYFIYTPYFVGGNKYHKYFNEYYEFISEFKLINLGISSSEEITLYRVMNEDEFKNYELGLGVTSPSFTVNPFYLQFMRGNNVLMDINEKSHFVIFKFKLEDTILNYDICGEGEIVVGKGSTPLMFKKYFEFNINDLKDDLGGDVVDYLPLSTYELNNGFTYMDGLINKGYDVSKMYEKIGSQWFRFSTKGSWVDKYNLSVQKLLGDENISNNNVSMYQTH